MTKAVSLYVHLPFCVKKCLFCSFAVSVGQAHRMDDYVRALGEEARIYKNHAVKTVYFGGGTPSFLPAPALERLVAMVRDHFIVSDGAEWTIEANPEDIDAVKTRVLKGLGFTRISLGVQSFDDAYLKFLGRAHDCPQALRALDCLHSAGFDNINVDLMYGFPGQRREELRADLEVLAGLNSGHVSIYTLTIEPNSRFYARQMKLDGDDKLADDYVFVAQFLEDAGCKQYEVSNFARPGFESKHNKTYWQGGDYIGLGLGAHSLLANRRFWNTGTLKDYLEKIQAQGNALEGQEELSARTRLLERLIFGLRMNEGVDIALLEKESGLMLPKDTKKSMDDFIRDGFLTVQEGTVKTTVRGRLILDEIAGRLI